MKSWEIGTYPELFQSVKDLIRKNPLECGTLWVDLKFKKISFSWLICFYVYGNLKASFKSRCLIWSAPHCFGSVEYYNLYNTYTHPYTYFSYMIFLFLFYVLTFPLGDNKVKNFKARYRSRSNTVFIRVNRYKRRELALQSSSCIEFGGCLGATYITLRLSF